MIQNYNGADLSFKSIRIASDFNSGYCMQLFDLDNVIIHSTMSDGASIEPNGMDEIVPNFFRPLITRFCRLDGSEPW